MPEGPEIRRMVDDIGRAVVNCDAARVFFAFERFKGYESALKLIERTYRLKGVTNDPERVKRLKKEGLSFGQRRHMVFNRGGRECYACGCEIVKTAVASRRLYYCPNCQPAPV